MPPPPCSMAISTELGLNFAAFYWQWLCLTIWIFLNKTKSNKQYIYILYLPFHLSLSLPKSFSPLMIHCHFQNNFGWMMTYFKLTWAESSSELFWSPVVRRLFVRPSVRQSVNFSHFHLLLQNHWVNFNQSWHKASLGKGDLSLFKWRALSFSKGR